MENLKHPCMNCPFKDALEYLLCGHCEEAQAQGGYDISCDTCRHLDKKTRGCEKVDRCLSTGECGYEGKKRCEEYSYSCWEPEDAALTTEEVNMASGGDAEAEREDTIHHPGHYTNGKIETWDLIELASSDEEFRGYLKGNLLKYHQRYRRKGGVQDLKKMTAYIERLMEFENGIRIDHFCSLDHPRC